MRNPGAPRLIEGGESLYSPTFWSKAERYPEDCPRLDITVDTLWASLSGNSVRSARLWSTASTAPAGRRELCDKQGWTDRAETLRDRAGSFRERAGERAAEGCRALADRWGVLDREAQRRVYIVAGLCGVILLTAAARGLVFRGPSMPSAQELALVEAMRARGSKGRQWYSAGQGSDPMLFRQGD